MMAVADSILDFAVATCQKEYSTIFLYNFPIQDADTPNHRIFEPRADKQTPMMLMPRCTRYSTNWRICGAEMEPFISSCAIPS